MLPVSFKNKSFDTERWIVTPVGGTVVQVLGIRPASPKSTTKQASTSLPQTDPATLCQTPIGLQTEGASTGRQEGGEEKSFGGAGEFLH